jgi:hypothetical protein
LDDNATSSESNEEQQELPDEGEREEPYQESHEHQLRKFRTIILRFEQARQRVTRRRKSKTNSASTSNSPVQSAKQSVVKERQHQPVELEFSKWWYRLCAFASAV